MVFSFFLPLGIVLTVPAGAIGRNQTEEVFVAALRDDKDRPPLLGKTDELAFN